MENKNWENIYSKVAAEAEKAREKSRQGLLLSNREAAIIREKELYDRMERGGVIIATRPLEQPASEQVVADDPVDVEKITIEEQEKEVVNDHVKQQVTEQEVDQDEDGVGDDANQDKQNTHDEPEPEQIVISDDDGATQDDPVPPIVTQSAQMIPDVSMQKTPEELERIERTRAAAWHTIHRIGSEGMDYEVLNASTKDESEKKFLELTRKLWTELVVHGTVDNGNGSDVIKRSDLDGESCLELMNLSGVTVDRSRVIFVAPGETFERGVIMDTSGTLGVQTHDEGKSVTIDHHANDALRDTSATKFVYETLVDMGLLTREEYLDRYVEFVTQMDNFDIPQDRWSEIYKDYHANLYGLGSVIAPSDLIELFKSGCDPAQKLSQQYLKRYAATLRDGSVKKLEKISKDIEGQMKRASADIAALEREGFVIDTHDDRFGKILIDPKKINVSGRMNNRVSGSFNSAQLSVFDQKDKNDHCKYGGYITWSPEKNGFVVYTRNAMSFDPPLDERKEGFLVRTHMWMKPQSDESLDMTLQDILSRMTGQKITLSKYLEGALRANDAAKEVMTEITTENFTKKYVRDKCGKYKVGIEKVFHILASQNSKLIKYYKELIAVATKDLDDARKKEFFAAFRKNKGATSYTKEQKEDQKELERIYIESICAFNAACIGKSKSS